MAQATAPTTTYEMTAVQLLANGIIQVQGIKTTIVDGETFTKPVAASFTPDADLSDQPADFVAVCEAWWTEERRAGYAEAVVSADAAMADVPDTAAQDEV